MKNSFFVLLCVCSPLLFISNMVASQTFPPSYSEKSSERTLNKQGCRLVNKIWQNVNKGRIHSLKSMMTPHFRTVGWEGDVVGKTDTVKILEGFIANHLQVAKIPAVISILKNDLLIVYYSVGVTYPNISGTVWIQQESMFKKIHHKWMWTEEADSIIQPVVPDAKVGYVSSSFLQRMLPKAGGL